LHALYKMWCKQFIIHTFLVAVGLWHLGSLFYHNTQYSQRGWFTNLLWCDIPWNKAPLTGSFHIWCTYKLGHFFCHEKNTDGRFWGAQDIFSRLMAVLHVTTPQLLQITPELQEARLWALL